MKRQVIQTVLNLPGISGIALIDGRNRPFFLGSDISLNTQQQDALAQGIQQVVETTPAQFETFAFRFSTQLAHIYKLDEGLILLVLISDQMALTEYRAAIKALKETLVEEPHNAVPTFRLLAGCVTLGSGALSDAPPSADLPADPPADLPARQRPTVAVAPIQTSGQASGQPTVEGAIAALNHLSDGATQYLGKIIVVNTWKQSRPPHPGLDSFEVQRDGYFSVRIDGQTLLTPDQHQGLKDWVAAFLSRGGKTIRNFQSLVCDQTLTPEERSLLLGQPSD